MNGSVRRRTNGDWEYRFDAGQDPLTGGCRRPGRSGVKTKCEATQACELPSRPTKGAARSLIGADGRGMPT